MKTVKVSIEFEVEVDVDVESTEELMKYVRENVFSTTMSGCSYTGYSKSVRNHEVFDFVSTHSLVLKDDNIVISKSTYNERV